MLVWLNLDYPTEEMEGVTFFEDLIPCFLAWVFLMDITNPFDNCFIFSCWT